MLLPSFVAPRWLVNLLGPEDKQRKQRTPRVIRIRDQISLHMRGSMATPAGGTVGDRRDEGSDTYLPGSIPVQSDWNHSAPRADHCANHGIQESTLSVCSWSIPVLVDVKLEGTVNSLEFSEYPDPHEHWYNISVSVLEHCDGGRPKDIGGGEVRKKG